jgi:hypothetical protein
MSMPAAPAIDIAGERVVNDRRHRRLEASLLMGVDAAVAPALRRRPIATLEDEGIQREGRITDLLLDA